MLPKWVKVSKERFNEKLNTVTKGKNEGLRKNVYGREIRLDNTERLLKGLGNGILDRHDFISRYNNIANDVEAIVNTPIIARNQEKIVKTMSLSKEILKTKSDEQPNTIDIFELESEESAAERRNQPGKWLKRLTPVQMLSRLPITLPKLKAGNIHKNLKTKLDNYCIFCTNKKEQNKSVIIWSTLFKNGNNLYEHWK